MYGGIDDKGTVDKSSTDDFPVPSSERAIVSQNSPKLACKKRKSSSASLTRSIRSPTERLHPVRGNPSLGKVIWGPGRPAAQSQRLWVKNISPIQNGVDEYRTVTAMKVRFAGSSGDEVACELNQMHTEREEKVFERAGGMVRHQYNLDQDPRNEDAEDLPFPPQMRGKAPMSNVWRNDTKAGADGGGGAGELPTRRDWLRHQNTHDAKKQSLLPSGNPERIGLTLKTRFEGVALSPLEFPPLSERISLFYV
ncbi:hypothetical protein CCHR01_02984 [Colletotrichum chrysophilum]|uniref:Uncharacterized protein n=1 Tax=Colletotrichum chrysophilum TaxID=1836956 RepID=A0AAD9ATQ4_9PEZI|nr:hypothetical protein CCHR01_02984 [Colletotrichum chrysophilum]